MSDPTVSVVIPTYNRAHLVGESIESVLAQRYRDLELIIVDDGSSDDTASVVKGFDDTRIKYIYQDNRGISGAQSTGIKHARGRYIALLGSDDLWLPRLLESEVPILDNDPDVGLVYAKAQAIDAHGYLKSQVQGAMQRYPGQALKSALYGNFVCTIAALMRQECFERVGLFDEALKATQDYDMWIRLAKHYEFAFLDEVLALFRQHAGRSRCTRRCCESLYRYFPSGPPSRRLGALRSRTDRSATGR